MKLIERAISGTTRLTAAFMNQIIDRVNWLSNVTVTPPLEIRQTTAGYNISLNLRALRRGGLGTEADSSAPRDALDFTQGTQDTDTWDIDASNKGVEVRVLTDVQYSKTTHKLTLRTRKLHIDPNGFVIKIDAESDLVEITTAESC